MARSRSKPHAIETLGIGSNAVRTAALLIAAVAVAIAPHDLSPAAAQTTVSANAETNAMMAESAGSERIFVMLDHAEIVRLDDVASTVIVGNPAIADASVFDAETLVITGKSYGTTNLIVLSSNGSEVANVAITVRAPDHRLLTVHKGALRESYDCSPNCQPSLVLGDDSIRFEGLKTQINGRIAVSEDQSGVASE